MKMFLVFFLAFLFVGCDNLGERLQFSVSTDDGQLYICTSINLTPVEEVKVMDALRDSPAGYGGSSVIEVEPTRIWNLRTVDDLVRIIKEQR